MPHFSEKCDTGSISLMLAESSTVSHLLAHVLYDTGEPGSSVSIVSGYGLDDRVIKVRSPAETKGFFL
jgi:hypothetical protein